MLAPFPWRLGAVLLTCVTFATVAVRPAAAQVLIAANTSDNAAGVVTLRRGAAPWRARAASLATGAEAVLALGPRGRLVALSRRSGTLTVASARTLRLRRTIELGVDAKVEDVAVSDACTAWVTRRGHNRLLRVDLCSGVVRESTDLAALADADGSSDLGAMFVDSGRLFVQVRRLNEEAPLGFAAPAYLAVVDTRSEQMIDCDTAAPGAQAIQLAGTAPKHRMQIQPGSRRLLISASGGFFDAGGLEAVDLDALRSDGLLLREEDGKTGADLGPVVMTGPNDGFLIFSTDLTLSSHLLRFNLRGGVEPGPERYVTVDFAITALVHETRGNAIFFADGAFDRVGAYAVDATTGERLTKEPLPIAGRPTDVLLLGSDGARDSAPR